MTQVLRNLVFIKEHNQKWKPAESPIAEKRVTEDLHSSAQTCIGLL